MGKSGVKLTDSGNVTYKYLFYGGFLPMLVLSQYLGVEQIQALRQVNAAVINVSGRQRMLSQRLAFLCCQLLLASSVAERQGLRLELLDLVAQMERAHQSLIEGDLELGLVNPVSPEMYKMYFDAPLYLDQKLQEYLETVRRWVAIPDGELGVNHPDYRMITMGATSLLHGLDVVVNRYQQENEQEQLAIDRNQAMLYEQVCDAMAVVQAQKQEVEQTLHELEQTQAQLLHSEKMASLGEMLASVAHEINNPVNFIYGNLSHAEVYTQDLLHLLRCYQECYPAPAPELQRSIDEVDLEFIMEDLPKVLCSMQMGSDRIRQIVKSLRHFSRKDDGQMSWVDLHEGLDSTLLILRKRLQSKIDGRDIEVIKKYGKIPAIECYPGQLNQVFMNIISNAIDALEDESFAQEKESLMIEISTAIKSEGCVIIRIADNGPGIPPHLREKIFERFFTTKILGKGTGLGLAISYEIIVDNHQGHLRCESEVGGGTTFWIELPVEQSLRVPGSEGESVTSR